MSIREIEFKLDSIKTLLDVNAKNLIKQFERLNCSEYRAKRMMDPDCSLQTSHIAGIGAWGRGQSEVVLPQPLWRHGVLVKVNGGLTA